MFHYILYIVQLLGSLVIYRLPTASALFSHFISVSGTQAVLLLVSSFSFSPDSFFAPDFGTFRELFLTLFLVMCVRFYQCGSTDCLEQWSIQAVQLSSRSLGSSGKVRGGPAGRPGCRGRAWGAPSPAASEAACVSWCALCAANRVEINMYFVWNTDSHNFLKIRLCIFVSI